MTTSGIHHFAIKVRNLVAAERFYRDVLGLTVARRWPASDGGGDRSVWLATGDGTGSFLALEVLGDVEMAHAADTTTPPPPRSGETEAPGHHLLALRIRRDERPQWESRLAAAGVAITRRSAYTVYFADPEGNRLGLSHHPDPVESA